MRCREVRLWLEEFACDGVDPAREAAFHAHLAACPECAAEWRAVTEVDALLADYRPLEPPPALLAETRAAIRQAIAAPPPTNAWFSWLLRPARVGVGACLLLGVLVSGFWLRDRDLRQTAAGGPAAEVAAVPAEAAPVPAEAAAAPAAPTAAVTAPTPAASPPRVALAAPASPTRAATRAATSPAAAPSPAARRRRGSSPLRVAQRRPSERRATVRHRAAARREGAATTAPAARPAPPLAESLVVVALAAPRVTSHSSSAFTLRAAGDDARESIVTEHDPRPATTTPREEAVGSGLRVTAAVVESWPTDAAAGGVEAAR